MEISKEGAERFGEICISDGFLLFCCSLCDSDFNVFKEYLDHLINFHDLTFQLLERVESIERTNVENLTNSEDTEEIYLLQSENEIDPNEIDSIENGVSNQTESKFFNSDYNDEQPIEDYMNKSNTFKCPTCFKFIKNKSNLAKHIRRHSDINKRFQCSECPKRFHQRFELEQHERTHKNERPYLCPSCGQNFITTGKLNAHINKVHKNERKQVCNICNKTFFNNNFLRSHMAVHTEDRNFKCDFEKCKATFKRRKTLVAHVKLHENKFEYKCNICDAKFNQRPALKAHVKKQHVKKGEID